MTASETTIRGRCCRCSRARPQRISSLRNSINPISSGAQSEFESKKWSARFCEALIVLSRQSALSREAPVTANRTELKPPTTRRATSGATSAGQYADDASRWRAVVRRDRAAHDVFFYSVRTTGVYCRPSCAARLARRENVCFHATREQAERAGFRPCKRCRPDEAPIADRQRDVVTHVCRLIEAAAEAPPLTALSHAVGMSPYHFHRVFKMMTGVTPKAYAAALRVQRVSDDLARGATVTAAIYGAGFNSNGRFYASATEQLGMTPTAFKALGHGRMPLDGVG